MAPTSGGCLCGDVRYQYRGDVGPAAYCHCDDCRRCTGSAFNVSVRLDLPLFTIVRGSPKGFTKVADSGNSLTRYFCTGCGSPIYTGSPQHPAVVYVKAGSIDDPALVKPTRQSWVRSAVSWGVITPELSSSEEG